ncbi:nucleoside hydrolase [Nocardioides sp. YIM 152315]|uniref:nucleoside hydrolase n=1 Tax=Nocardioides sp. YIM 152315 TaxID=3031760 RepID=UPI0023DC48FD|nr:nucleoside hydrolase [Nocardioides sp. YIM 152315]MDF1605405.1 nucleoside hydrolase [Nocardioides sp. YIM 152315]
MGEPLRIILDTDLAMGAPDADIDDGFALALALADPGIVVDLVTTVGGNSDVVTSTRLTRDLVEVLGRPEVPVVQGAAADEGAAREIVRRVRAEPGELTVVAIGPLTNVARALQLDPDVARDVREIVVMGGVYLEQTNVAAMPGEYNFWCDPGAAQAVMESGAPLRLVGLDVTRQVRLTRADADAIAEGGRFGRIAGSATHGWIDFQERAKPREELEQGSCALHDPLAVAVVTRPDLVTWTEAHVAVETEGRFTRGVAVADLLMWQDPPTPNCRIATAVDAAAFRELFLERMASLP